MRKFFLCLIVFFFISSLSSCKRSNVILEGNVFESFKSTPLPKMEVLLNGKKAKTDENGHFKVEGLKKGAVEIVIKGSNRYEDFKDRLVLDEGTNRRDFLLEAKHPLNIPVSEIVEPNSFAYSIFIGLSPDKPLAIAEVESSKSEPALHIKGKEYDEKGNVSEIEVIQVGTNFWIRDKYGNWNAIQNPGESIFRINSIFYEKYYPASIFFKDPNISYKDTGKEIIIDNVKTHKFLLTLKEIETGFIDNLEIFVIKEGKNKGRVKKIISNAPMRSMYPYVSIILSKFDEDLRIMPPAITQ